MIRPTALAAAIAISLLAVSGAGGAGTQTPKRGGTVVIANLSPGEPACLNPFVETCGIRGGLDLGLYEVLLGAFQVTPEATFRPRLISRAEIVSKQPVTLVYHIRPEARWSDGVRVTASDFVFTDQALRRYRPGGPSAFYYLAFARSIHVVDPKTFKLVLRAPFPDWRLFFDLVLPRHALAGQKFESLWSDSINNPKTGKPIGSGPFLVGEWVRGRHLTLMRNPRYWGEHATYLNRIVFRFLPTDDAAAALRRGDVDMINPSSRILQPQSLEFVRRPQVGIGVLRYAVGAIEQFQIRIGEGGNPALKSRPVRQALAYGIDRVAISRGIGRLSFASPTALQPQDSFVFLTNSPYHQPNWKHYRYRPAQARGLLQQAGCERGQDRIYSCDGNRLSLRFVTTAGIESRERTVELAQEQLGQIGVEVIPVYVAPATFLSTTFLGSGDFDVALFSAGPGASTTGPTGRFGCQREENFSGYCDRLVTRDLVQADRVLNLDRRIGLLNRVDQRLARAVPALPLYQNKGLVALKATVRGFAPNGVGLFTWNAENWWLER